MDLLLTVLIIVGFSVLAGALWVGWNKITYKRNLAIYDNYDRDLTTQDIAFIEQAQEELKIAAEEKAPFRYKLFLYTAFVPMMFLCWAILGALLFGLNLVLEISKIPDAAVIFQEGGHLVWGYLISIFGGIFLAGAMLYAISLSNQKLSNFIALNSDINGFDTENVRSGLLSKLVHKIRSREQKTFSKFSVPEFLNGVNRSYLNGCMKWFYGCLIIAAIFGIFDLRSGVTFYADRMVGTGSYFSLSPKKGLSYNRISSVELECQMGDNKANSYYGIYVDTEEFTRVKLTEDNVKELTEVNEILRGQEQIKFESKTDKSGENRLDPNCIQHLGKSTGQPERVKELLSVTN